MCKIAICWAFGVGKTTLINAIDYPNKVIDLERKITTVNPLDNPEEFNLVMFNSIINNEKKLRVNKVDFITNTSHIDNLAYMLYFNKKDYNYFIKQVKKYDIIFYIPPEIELEKDWYRYDDINMRNKIDFLIQGILSNFNCLKVKLTWTVEERVKQFYNVINNYEI